MNLPKHMYYDIYQISYLASILSFSTDYAVKYCVSFACIIIVIACHQVALHREVITKLHTFITALISLTHIVLFLSFLQERCQGTIHLGIFYIFL